MKLSIRIREMTFPLFLSSMVFSFCAGFVDMGLSIIIGKAPGRLESFTALSASLAACMIFSLIVYLVLRTVLNHINKSKKLEMELLSIFLFVGLLLSLAFYHLVRRVDIPPAWLIRSIFVGVAFVIAAGTCLLAASRKKWIIVFILMLPFLMAASLVHIHGEAFGTRGIPVPAVWSACFLAIALLYFMPDRWRRVTLLILWFSVPAAAIGLPKWQSWRTSQTFLSNRVNHSIRHIVLITVDTLRRDAISFYDPTRNHTENLDRLASESIVFTKAYSPASWTAPALISIMTGYSPLVHQWYTVESGFPTSIPMLAERMRAAGYFTGSVTNTATTRLMASLKRRPGFHESDSYPKAPPDRSIGTDIVDLIFPGYFQSNISTAQLTSHAANWVMSNKARDFFLWIHYLDPHLPYIPPASYISRSLPSISGNDGINDLGAAWRSGDRVFTLQERSTLRMLYEGEVRYVDDSIGRLLQVLKQQGIYDDTLLILLSDHGEELWEKGGFGHGHSLYNPILKVPLIIKLPNSQSKQQIHSPVSTDSILPTIMDLCNIPLPHESGLSISLVPLWKKSQETTHRLVSVSTLFGNHLMSLIFEKYKYIRDMDSGEEELYNLEEDPNETHNIKDQPEKLEQARQILEEEKHKADIVRERQSIRNESNAMDEDTRGMFRALGYLR